MKPASRSPRHAPAMTGSEETAAPEAGAPPIAAALAAFAHDLRCEDIPASVRERARHLMLDATGIALASTRWDFAHKSLAAVRGLAGAGDCTVIGMPVRLPLRDAVMLNGILVHGLDYDDTHLAGLLHPTASAFPCALGVAEHLALDGPALLAAYVVGVECATRLGIAGGGGILKAGFPPTGLIGAFGCTLLTGRLLGATPAQLAMAQGITLSTAAGSLEFLEDGAWTARLHPGWAGVAGITGAALARQGFMGPQRPYEGRFGLFPGRLGPLAEKIDLSPATAGLGETWELERVAVKPYPACHFIHGCVDAALELARVHDLRPGEIAAVRALIPAEVVETVCEPAANKLRPVSDFDAKYSLPFVVAASLARRRFSLAELEDEALHDETILALAARVRYGIDPASPFPRAYSGEVIVTTRDGRELRHREEVNRGAAGRPLANGEIAEKFMDNARMAVSAGRAARIRDAVLGLEDCPDVRALTAVLGG